MNKFFPGILSLCFFSLSLVAQQVPDSISQKFRTAYPNASNAKWQWENESYTVNYWDEKNVEHNVVYDKFGKMKRAQHQVGPDQIPTGISEYYRKNYPDNEDYKVWMEDDGTGNTKYFVPEKNEVMWFDGEGNYSKRSPAKKATDSGNKKRVKGEPGKNPTKPLNRKRPETK